MALTPPKFSIGCTQNPVLVRDDLRRYLFFLGYCNLKWLLSKRVPLNSQSWELVAQGPRPYAVVHHILGSVMKINLLVADDHAVVREGVATILKGSDIQVVAEAETGNQAIEQAMKLKPDVVLLDVRMPDTDGLEALERITDRSPRTKVVMFTGHENPTYIARAVALGAAGFVMKGASKDEIVTAINRAHTGLPPETDSIMGKVRNTMARRRPTYDEDIPLTNREVQVLRHVALGLSNREIGRSLDISIETVKEHVQNILRKLEAGDRTEAAVWAVKKGLV
jgi:DNA-binding NarL/FixJ family response regulator